MRRVEYRLWTGVETRTTVYNTVLLLLCTGTCTSTTTCITSLKYKLCTRCWGVEKQKESKC